MAGKYAAKGALLKVEIAAVLTLIPSVEDFNIPLGSPDLIDVTTHDSAGEFKEYVSGMKDGKEMTIPMVWDAKNAVHAALAAALGGAALNFQATGKESPAPATYTFSALVRDIEVQLPVNGAQKATMVLKPTGAIVIA